MAGLLAGAVWTGLIAWLMLRLHRQFRTHRATLLDRSEDVPASMPGVAVIAPARDEIANIDTCLAGLTAQRGLTGGLSIIVVDDGSQDGTAQAVARS
jgi:cellulose synthase/poly-beta-1,6-N-acetylglucosamine synthase-like glycosyltransferase